MMHYDYDRKHRNNCDDDLYGIQERCGKCKQKCHCCSCADNRGPQGPRGPQGLQGPQGAQGIQGIPGAAILDSYETLAQLIQAHPVGNVGDAYLVDGVMYIWDAAATPPAWKAVGDLNGPRGLSGTAILGSYDTLAELQAEHPEGNVGDAYLVSGELYVWQVDEATGIGGWESVGSLVGPTGDTGAFIYAQLFAVKKQPIIRPTPYPTLTRAIVIDKFPYYPVPVCKLKNYC